MLLEAITNFRETHPKEMTRFVKFSIVGAIGAVIDFGLLNLGVYILRDILQWSLLPELKYLSSQANGNVLVANVFSVSVAIISNFIWNRLWTYPESRTRKKREQLPQFALVNLAGLVINTAIVVALDALLVSPVGEPWSYNIAKAVAIGVVLFWNFVVNRLWTYRGL
jgi:putative flippase GtrA